MDFICSSNAEEKFMAYSIHTYWKSRIKTPNLFEGDSLPVTGESKDEDRNGAGKVNRHSW